MSTITEWLQSMLNWFLDQLMTFAVWVFDGLLSVIDAVISSIPGATLAAYPSILTIGNDTLMLFGSINGWQALGMIGGAMIIRLGTGFFLR